MNDPLKFMSMTIKEDDDETLGEFLQDKQLDEATLGHAFMMAAQLGKLRTLKVLRPYQHNIDVPDHMFQENGVMQAAGLGHAGVIEYLLSEGANVNCRSPTGNTALHVAAVTNKPECVQVLLDFKGIEKNICNGDGFTPLTCATHRGQIVIIRMLLEAKCDVTPRISVTPHQGKMAIHMCFENYFLNGDPARAKATACLHVFLEAGVNPDLGDDFGSTPIHYAIRTNNIMALQQLIRANCSLDSASRDIPFNTARLLLTQISHVTPLVLCILQQNLAFAQLIVAAGGGFQQNLDWAMTYLKNESFKQWLEDVLSTPRTLRDCCRHCIRRHMGPFPQHRIHLLKLPKTLENYILSFDMDL